MGTTYVYKLGDTGIYKVGKTKDLEKRHGAHATMSADKLILYEEIPTSDETEVELFMKHRLQSRRWLGGEGRELYEVDQAELDEVIAAAQAWDAELPKMAEAERLTKERSDGRILTPGEAEKELHRELLRLRQIELVAAQERKRIETQLKILLQTADGLEGIVTWRTSEPTLTFDATRLKEERPELHDEYNTRVIIKRPFNVRW